MKFAADLHIHSKFSRATARNLDFESLYHAAQIKGIHLVGTGDFTYPDWVQEIEDKLEPAEPGLFALKKEIAMEIDKKVPAACRNPVRFILQAEISNIYKKEGKVRKNHNLIYFSTLAAVKKMNARLDAIGNIRSDGRPILGLDAADLLALMLEIDETGMFIPAHIWTPWFSMFGSKSGFDSIEECFGSLKKYIFAVETGLSSDPPMNWRVKDLDHVSLISNSDAHSPGYLGRNATVFNTELSYQHIRNALKTKNLETLDMYPDQGKYHYDGHRNCGVCLNPSATLELGGICSECGKTLTCGVLYRVQELADRPEGHVPQKCQNFSHMVPLTDLLSEIFSVGPKTKKVAMHYNKAIEKLGPELSILLELPLEKIESAGIPMLSEAIDKMRNGKVSVNPGFDGEFGKVRIFSQQERDVLKGEKYFLFKDVLPKSGKLETKTSAMPPLKVKTKKRLYEPQTRPLLDRKADGDFLEGLNPEQRAAVTSEHRQIMIQAGPGTGKTMTLTAKIAFLISRKMVLPENILALTFTNKAAFQLTERISRYAPSGKESVTAATFHSFCLMLLKQYKNGKVAIPGEMEQKWLFKTAVGEKIPANEMARIVHWISLCKQSLLSSQDDLSPIVGAQNEKKFQKVYSAYEGLCRENGFMDFEDLIYRTVRLLEQDPAFLKTVQKTFPYVFIDEYQDLNYAQYVLVQKLFKNAYITVIGDPDQSIYGFRGSDNLYFKKFSQDFPGCASIGLTQNYRSTQMILDASFQMISGLNSNDDKIRVYSQDRTQRQLIVKECATEKSEAVSIARMIDRMVGGTSFFSMDTRRIVDSGREYGFGDIAVLYRTRKQCRILMEVFEKEGIPCRSADKQKLLELPEIQRLLAACRMLAGRNRMEKSDGSFAKAMLKEIFGSTNKAQRTMKMISGKPGLFLPVHGKGMGNTVAYLCQALGLERLISEDETHRIAYEKIQSVAHRYQDMGSVLDAVSLEQDADVIGFETQNVSLMTIHAAKGLEFPAVFVAGCEQGLIPYDKNSQKPAEIEEERRLFYVAMTRAMDILCLTYAQKRSIYGRIEKRQRSIFIDDIEGRLKKMEKSAFRPVVKKQEQQLELFPPPL